MHTKQWKAVRAKYLQLHPYCERCLEEGRIASAVDVHHIIPVETGKTYQEMEYLCYGNAGSNLRALCIPCHIKTHAEMKSHSRKAHQQRAKDRNAQWLEKVKPKTPPTQFS